MEFLLKNPQQWIVGQMYKIKFATYIESDEEMRIQGFQMNFEKCCTSAEENLPLFPQEDLVENQIYAITNRQFVSSPHAGRGGVTCLVTFDHTHVFFLPNR